MKVVVVLGVLAVAGAALYLGVFRVSADNSAEKTNVTVTVDKEKLGEAKDKAKDEINEVGREVKEKAGEMGKKPTTAQ